MASFLFASHFLKDLFIPFVAQFASHPFTNPYAAFAATIPDAFPYPPLMLFILAIPKLVASVLGAAGPDAFLNPFLLRIPLLAADLAILFIFFRLLPGRQESVLKYYWASPVLFYISYVHGQLDVIPIALLLGSVALLFWKHRWALPASFALFGAAAATKTSVLIAFPFLLMYVWKQHRSALQLVSLSLISVAVFAFAALPFLGDAFVRMVFLSEQQGRLFAFSLPLYSGLVLFVAPLAYCALFFRFAGYRRLSPDALMMILSLVFTVFVLLVPPRPGWFYWGLPFLIYFFVRSDALRPFTYWTLNGLYFLFFWTWKDGDIPQVLQHVMPRMATAPNIYERLAAAGLPADVVSSALFSVLAAALIVASYWIYRFGIRRHDEHYLRSKPISIGVGGDSGAGKSTFSDILIDTFGAQNTLLINGDDVHKWERGNENWQKYTHLNPQSNRLHLDYQQALQLANGRPIQRASYDHGTGRFTAPVKLSPTRFLIFAGLHPFYLKGMREMQDLRVFLDPDDALRKHWKIVRDQKERGHDKKAVLASMKKRAPDAKKFINPQRDFSDLVVSLRPAKEIVPGEPKDHGPLVLHVRMDNSIDAERIHEALAPIASLRVSQQYEENCEHQVITFDGHITAQEVRTAAARLVPDYYVLTGNEPKWRDGMNGILQLITLYHLNETLSRNHDRA